jgi:hypothetical protein
MNSKDLERKESAAVTLLTLISGDIHIPSKRIEDKSWNWFLRNLQINHSEHPLFPSTIEVIKFIVKHKST